MDFMEGMHIECVKIDNISREKRMLCYWFYIQKMQDDSFDEIWNKYKALLHATENWKECYAAFLINNTTDDESKMIEELYAATGHEDKSEQNILEKTWSKVKDIIKREIDCEKKLHDELNKKAEEHPIISSIIIAILATILLGLIKDCIYDAIQTNNMKSEPQVNIIYITDGDDNCFQISYENGKIIIKETEVNVNGK